MPALIMTSLVVPLAGTAARIFWKVGKATFAVWGAVAIHQQRTHRWAADLDLNPVRDEWLAKQGFPAHMGHYRLREEDLKHPSQRWALGDFFFYEFEWLQFFEYLEVDAANRTAPGSRWTGIDGERLQYVGRKRFLDPKMRSVMANAQRQDEGALG